jgi:hypothetical protein
MSEIPAGEFLLPLFPLPNIVFFPHTRLPLHVFEPRYRQMVSDALEVEEKQKLLEIDDLIARVERVGAELQNRIETLRFLSPLPAGSGSEQELEAAKDTLKCQFP